MRNPESWAPGAALLGPNVPPQLSAPQNGLLGKHPSSCPRSLCGTQGGGHPGPLRRSRVYGTERDCDYQHACPLHIPTKHRGNGAGSSRSEGGFSLGSLPPVYPPVLVSVQLCVSQASAILGHCPLILSHRPPLCSSPTSLHAPLFLSLPSLPFLSFSLLSFYMCPLASLPPTGLSNSPISY